MVDAGKLTKRIILQKSIMTQNTYGEEVPTWETISSVWAQIIELRGKEFWTSKQLNSEITSKLTIRYRTDVDTTVRIMYGSRIFYILSIIRDDNTTYLELMCKEVA